MSERQPCVVQEREGQIGPTAHAREAGAERSAQGCEIRSTDVRELARFNIAPDLFDRIQVRRVGRQAFDGEPSALARDVRRHPTALVRPQAVPDEDDPLTSEVPFEIVQERDEPDVGIGVRLALEEEARAAAIPAKGQGASHREPFPVRARMNQDRRLPARGPGAPDNRVLGDAAFVLEDEPATSLSGVFFSCVQRRVFHSAIAASSRSRARRAGRWRDQPNPRSTRHTWPG